MMNNFIKDYSEGINSLKFSDGFETKIIQQMTVEHKHNGKITALKVIALAAVIVITAGATVFALPHFLTAAQVAERMNMTEIGQLLDSEKAIRIEKTVIYNDIVMILHSAVKGSELQNIEGVEVDIQRNYFVISVMNKNGEPLDVATNEIRFTPLVKGYKVYELNICTLGSSVSIIQENGVLYYLINTETLEPYKNEVIYLYAFSGIMPFGIIEEGKRGRFEYADDYNGIKAVFELPTDF